MTKKAVLVVVLLLAFLCLVSCSSLLDDYLWQTGVFAPASTATLTTHSPQSTQPPISFVSSDSVNASQNNPTTSALSTAPVVTTLPQKNVTVVIDAGHGENDPGAVGYLNGAEYWEKHINLSVSQKLKEELVARGYTVLTIRDTDTSLLHGWDTQGEAVMRRNFGANSGADIYISLHCNSYAGSGRAWGPIIFYNGNGRYSPKSMVKILQSAVTSCSEKYEKMRECRLVDDGAYIVLQNKDMPSFLVEMGFLSDESDLFMLLDEEWQYDLSRSLANGIDELYKDDYIG